MSSRAVVECSRMKYNQAEPSRAMIGKIDSTRAKQKHGKEMVEFSRFKWCQVEPSRAMLKCTGVE